MMEYDVVIVGANIAGCYLAYLLRQREVNVVVVEEHGETGVPLQCAGIISQKLARIIELDKDLVLNRVKTARLVSPDGTQMDMRGPESPFVIDRVGLDKHYHKKARDWGADFLFGERFRTYRKIKDDEIHVLTDKRTIRAKIVVGCDGPLSRVAELNGIHHNVVYGTQVRARYEIDNAVTEMHFDERWKEMFGWVIPEGNGVCRIGLGCINNPRKNFEFFLDKLDVDRNDIIDRQGGLIPWGYIRDIAFDNALLLGDAACMVKATTGGGVVMLLNGAQIAANAIVKAVTKNDFSRHFLNVNYQAIAKIKIGAELKVHYLLRIMLTHFTARDFNWFFTLYQNSPAMQNIVRKYADMDFPKRMLLKLVLNRSFARFAVHMVFRNLGVIPKFVHLLVGKYKFEGIGRKRHHGTNEK